jgi:hypothetical protein
MNSCLLLFTTLPKRISIYSKSFICPPPIERIHPSVLMYVEHLYLARHIPSN